MRHRQPYPARLEQFQVRAERGHHRLPPETGPHPLPHRLGRLAAGFPHRPILSECELQHRHGYQRTYLQSFDES
ncbi:MAG TPA: hypothetical protein VGL63_08530 [Streptosporangiaceae bacterium]